MVGVRQPASRHGNRHAGAVHLPAPRHSWDPPGAPEPLASAPRPRPVRRLLTTLAVLGLLIGLVVVALHVSLLARLDRIDGAFDGLGARPAGVPGETILMVGTRPGGRADVPWLPGDQSVESVMLVEVGADRTQVRVESLPLDDALAASMSSSLPSDSVRAVESWSGRRVDHLMAIDWRVFAQLASDNGVDPTYAYGDSLGVQQTYLRTVLQASLHAELRKEPLNLYRALSTVAGGAAIDDGWSILELDRLVFSLRDLRSRQIEFFRAQPR